MAMVLLAGGGGSIVSATLRELWETPVHVPLTGKGIRSSGS